jgi:hypothetical protein
MLMHIAFMACHVYTDWYTQNPTNVGDNGVHTAKFTRVAMRAHMLCGFASVS